MSKKVHLVIERGLLKAFEQLTDQFNHEGSEPKGSGRKVSVSFIDLLEVVGELG